MITWNNVSKNNHLVPKCVLAECWFDYLLALHFLSCYIHWNIWWLQVHSWVWLQLQFLPKTCLWGWWFGNIDRQLFSLKFWMYSCRWWWQWPKFPGRWSYLAPFMLMLACPWSLLRKFPRLTRTLVSKSWHVLRVLPSMPKQNGLWMWSMFFWMRPCAATPCIW